MQEDEIKEGDYLIPLLDIIPTPEEVHKFASIMLTQENKRIKLITDEESEQALIEYKIACEEVGIKEADDLMEGIILAHTLYSIVDDRVYDPNQVDEDTHEEKEVEYCGEEDESIQDRIRRYSSTQGWWEEETKLRVQLTLDALKDANWMKSDE